MFLAMMTPQAIARSPSAAPEQVISGNAIVTDADTITIGGRTIRLLGLDAPETRQICIDNRGEPWQCGIAAKEAMESIIGTRQVACTVTSMDLYKRYLAWCRAEETPLNATIVARGWALAYRKYGTELVPHEDTARQSMAGLWSGAFIAPWDWRGRNDKTTIHGAYAVPIDSQDILVRRKTKK